LAIVTSLGGECGGLVGFNSNKELNTADMKGCYYPEPTVRATARGVGPDYPRGATPDYPPAPPFYAKPQIKPTKILQQEDPEKKQDSPRHPYESYINHDSNSSTVSEVSVNIDTIAIVQP
jgi:hypothetical protein